MSPRTNSPRISFYLIFPAALLMRSALYKLHFAVFLWGFTGVLGKAIQLNEGWLVWWRLLISTCSLWVVYLATSNLHKIKWRDFFKIALIGTILSLHWLFFYGS
ncbi:MAG: hypothetical protein KGM98_11685, partial [Bacteroidota bacterium]|nr:hypothetical protein [Bacteroidota bacterium]